jgi:hypothetical protein
MKLKLRIERLEERLEVGRPIRLTVALFDSILNGTITDKEFERHRPLLAAVLGLDEDDSPHAEP